MYTLYTDKSEDFKCKIELEGADLSDTQSRLVLKTGTHNYLFEGTIDGSGNCTVPLKNLKKLFKNGDEGEIVLEVIAEDTFFSPWSDSFEAVASKKIAVEVMGSSNNKPQIKESRIKVSFDKKKAPKPAPKPKFTNAQIVAEALKEQGINLSNVLEESNTVAKVIKTLSEKNIIKEHTNSDIFIKEIINYLN